MSWLLKSLLGATPRTTDDNFVPGVEGESDRVLPMEATASSIEPPLRQNQQQQKIVITEINLSNQIPILPLVNCVKYSHRPTDHLTLAVQRIVPFGPLPRIQFKYLSGNPTALKKENLYPFQNYLLGFEGAVTHLWISILVQFRADRMKYMVLDGGMNTGFYTLLSAVMGFEVDSFELQLDCFDVSRSLLQSNGVKANLYHIGLSDAIRTVIVGEGCNPSYNLATPNHFRPMEKKWKRRLHQVPLLPLDTFLDQRRGDRQIAILKLDVEGEEILALRGLERHLPAVQNIIIEINPAYSRRSKVKVVDIQQKFLELQAVGFRPYLLWMPGLQPNEWLDTDLVERAGLRIIQNHPILGSKLQVALHNTTMMWEVANWDSIFNSICKIGCNFLLTRMAGEGSNL